MMETNGGKVKKEILAQWMDLAFTKALSKSNIVASFRATGIWPLNLERIEAKMGPSKPFYSIPSRKVLVEEIMEENLPREKVDVLYYYVEEEGEMSDEGPTNPKIATFNSHFLKLPRKSIQATRIQHEPQVDYALSQILTSHEHIEKMKEIAKKKP